MIYIADIVSAYPTMIDLFFLTPENVDKKGVEIDGVSFAQREGIVTKLVIKIGKIKANIKEQKKTNPSLSMRYKSIKSIYNSLFGVMAFKTFRLYNIKIPKTITFLVRDMLHYIESHIEFKVVFIDTDGIAYQAEKDLVDEFNKLAKQWAKEKYGKIIEDNIFESDRSFVKMLNVDNCHYIGQYADGTYKVRGLEMKSAASSKFKAEFQETLIKEKIFKDINYSETKKWVGSEKERFLTAPLLDIGVPAKLKDVEYKEFLIRGDKKFKKKLPIFVRALHNSKLKKRFGELFYWVYLKNGGVIAIDKKHLIDRDKIDWNKMTKNNIDNTAKKIFDVMGWSEQKTLF